MSKVIALIVLIALAAAEPAQAYVGPGSSLGAIGVFLGILGTVLLAVISFVWYPVKRLARRLRHKDSSGGSSRD